MDSRFRAVALIVIGTILLIFGVTAWQSVSGAPTLKSIFLICVGVLSVVYGSSLLCGCK